MNPISDLQRNYPLSSKKFWKKFIDKMISLYVLGFLGLVVVITFMFLSSGANDPFVIGILWLLIGLIVLVVIVSTATYAWYLKVYIRRYYYAGEEHFITIKKGVFAPAEIHVQWQKIQDVYVDQDILDRIMGLYDVHIASATASSAIEAHIDGVDHAAAEGLKKFLLDKVARSGNNYNASGGAVDPTMPQNTNRENPSIPQVKTVNFGEEISSNKYPLSNKWMTMMVISRFFGSFSISAIFVFAFISKMLNTATGGDYVIFILVWLGISILVTLFGVIGLVIWRKNYAFNFNTDNIYYKTGIISLSEKHMPYTSLQDVTIRQGVIERMFGLAKVVIENAAQNSAPVNYKGQNVSVFTGLILEGLTLADANHITEILKSKVLGRGNSQYGL